MKHTAAFLLALALTSGLSFADDVLDKLDFKQIADREIENAMAGKFENYRLIWGKPSANFQAAITDAQKRPDQSGSGKPLLAAIEAAQMKQIQSGTGGTGKPLLSAIEEARIAGTPGNPFTETANPFVDTGAPCVKTLTTDNSGGWIGNRTCGTIPAPRAWVQANLYRVGGYHLLASHGGLVDFGYHDNGATFLISYTPAGFASELTFYYNLAQ